jgi:hypothetical protein
MRFISMTSFAQADTLMLMLKHRATLRIRQV